MSDWISDAKPSLLPCRHGVEGYCVDCTMDDSGWAQQADHARLLAENERLREGLREIRHRVRHHVQPALGDIGLPCSGQRSGNEACECGANEMQARVDALLADANPAGEYVDGMKLLEVAEEHRLRARGIWRYVGDDRWRVNCGCGYDAIAPDEEVAKRFHRAHILEQYRARAKESP